MQPAVPRCSHRCCCLRERSRRCVRTAVATILYIGASNDHTKLFCHVLRYVDCSVEQPPAVETAGCFMDIIKQDPEMQQSTLSVRHKH